MAIICNMSTRMPIIEMEIEKKEKISEKEKINEKESKIKNKRNINYLITFIGPGQNQRLNQIV